MTMRMNAQVARTITGCLAGISGPISGSRYDAHFLSEPKPFFRSTRATGQAMRERRQQHDDPPGKNPVGGQLRDWQQEFTKQAIKIRYVPEQVSANFKTWRIMHTGCRR